MHTWRAIWCFQKDVTQDTQTQNVQKATVVRFELTRSKSNGLAIHRLNHSATLSLVPLPSRRGLNPRSRGQKSHEMPLHHRRWSLHGIKTIQTHSLQFCQHSRQGNRLMEIRVQKYKTSAEIHQFWPSILMESSGRNTAKPTKQRLAIGVVDAC